MSRRDHRLPLDHPLRRVYFLSEMALMLNRAEKTVRKYANDDDHWLHGCLAPQYPEMAFTKVGVDAHLPAEPPVVEAAGPVEYPALAAVK